LGHKSCERSATKKTIPSLRDNRRARLLYCQSRKVYYLVNKLCDDFYLKDEDKNKFKLAIDKAIIIEPSLTQDIALEFEIFSATGKLRLHFSRPKQKEILIIALDNTTEQ
jgi:hypothetical protein